MNLTSYNLYKNIYSKLLNIFHAGIYILTPPPTHKKSLKIRETYGTNKNRKEKREGKIQYENEDRGLK